MSALVLKIILLFCSVLAPACALVCAIQKCPRGARVKDSRRQVELVATLQARRG
jgi:hypothetical protein